MRGDRRLGGGSPEEAGTLAKAAHRPNLHSMESLPAAGPGDPSAYASGPDASGKVRKGRLPRRSGALPNVVSPRRRTPVATRATAPGAMRSREPKRPDSRAADPPRTGPARASDCPSVTAAMGPTHSRADCAVRSPVSISLDFAVTSGNGPNGHYPNRTQSRYDRSLA